MTVIGYTQNLPPQGDTEKLKLQGDTEKLELQGDTEKLELQGDTEKLELQGYTEKLIEPALWWSRLRNIVATVVFGCIIALVVLHLVPISKHQHYSGQAYTVVKTLQDPPEITQGPLTQAVKAGGIVAFYCFATGDPSPNITWKKNGKKLRYRLKYMHALYSAPSLLRIEPVRRWDAGSYECEARNRVSDPVSVEATLEVFDDKELPKGFPQIIQNPGMKVVEKGRNAVLVCEASGDPRPTVTWVRDTMPINIQVNSRLTLLKQGSLQIMEAEETDQGKYECVASNSVGTEYSYPAQLYVRVRRVPPHFRITPEPKYEVKSGDDLNITCVAVGKPMPFVKWKEGRKDLSAENKAPFGKNVLELTDIRSTSNYTCMAASKLGIIETHTFVKVQG